MNGNELLPKAPAIEALEVLDDLWEIRNSFEDKFGFRPENVSHWNPKRRFRTSLEALLPQREATTSIAEYLYSYDLKSHDDVLKTLREPDGRGCLFTPSGTASIVNVIAYLRNAGVNRIAAIRPYYFCFEDFARFCGIQVDGFQLTRTPTSYELPDPGKILAEGYKAVWLTTPVYCASVYFERAQLTRWLDQLSTKGLVVIADESLAWPNRAVIHNASDPSSLIAIYVPHKALSLNGFRFSVVTFPEHLQNSFDQWSDVLHGGLPRDCAAAIDHFCSPGFQQAETASRELGHFQKKLLQRLLGSFMGVEFDPQADGHFHQVYLPSLNGGLQQNRAFLTEVINRSGASFIPGSRFGYALEDGFCFRVNLFRLDEAGTGSLYRIVRALTDQIGAQ